MFSVDELLQKAQAYRERKLSLNDFDWWFEESVADEEVASEDSELLRLAVDSALAKYHFDHIGEDGFRKELANAIRPFEKEVRPEFLWRWRLTDGPSDELNIRMQPDKIPVQKEWLVSTGSNSNSASYAHLAAANNTIRTRVAGQART